MHERFRQRQLIDSISSHHVWASELIAASDVHQWADVAAEFLSRRQSCGQGVIVEG